jgi:demethylmenaquinone methyltransferase/2-methoxy-6-polyprenyl-1,4-benzoquinol methylase
MYQAKEPLTIQQAFSSIASRYDLANAINSLGLHYLWNHRLICAVKGSCHLLDLCAGTGQIGLGYLKRHPHAQATLVDFCPEMLAIAQKKIVALAYQATCKTADVMNLPFEAESFDGATMAYGIRNVKEPKKCFEEVYRVLKPGSTLAILELTRPHVPLVSWGHRLFTRTFLPLTGKLISKNKEAYDYLASSIQAFTSPENLIDQLDAAGFHAFECRPLSFGIATLIICQKG